MELNDYIHLGSPRLAGPFTVTLSVSTRSVVGRIPPLSVFITSFWAVPLASPPAGMRAQFRPTMCKDVYNLRSFLLSCTIFLSFQCFFRLLSHTIYFSFNNILVSPNGIVSYSSQNPLGFQFICSQFQDYGVIFLAIGLKIAWIFLTNWC
jgi:hypothetical protein